jgi:hypothetical protein
MSPGTYFRELDDFSTSRMGGYWSEMKNIEMLWMIICYVGWCSSIIDYILQQVLDHFTEKSFHRKILIERPFDRNTIWPNTVWPNAIWPKVHLTESPFNRRLFDRKFILPKKFIWPKTKFIKRSLDRKYLENGHLTENLPWKTSQMTEMTYDRNDIWPKAFFEK